MAETNPLDPNLKEYQIQKLYIKKLEDTDQSEQLENDLKDYFASFGSVIDVKTLRNCKLSSQKGTIRFRNFPGRGGRNRGAE